MKKLLSSLILVVLFSVQASAFAEADWRKYYIVDDVEFYVDANSIRKTGSYLRAWTLQDFRTERIWQDMRIKSILELEHFDCKNERTRTIKYTVFSENMRKGKALYTSEEVEDFEQVTPDSRGGYLLRSVCELFK